MPANSQPIAFPAPKPPTVRDLVRHAQAEMRAELEPSRARELLVMLTALIGNVNAASREADMAYNVVLLQHLESSEKANRARIKAESSPEYLRAREARDTKAEIIESVRSLKACIASLSDEMKLAR